MVIPKRVMAKATALWKAADEGQLILESASEVRTNTPAYFICAGGTRLARMVTAAENFSDPVAIVHHPSLFDLLESSTPMWIGWNERAADEGIRREFDLLQQNIRSKRFALAATRGYGGAEYLVYHVQDLAPSVTSLVPVAQILDDGAAG